MAVKGLLSCIVDCTLRCLLASSIYSVTCYRSHYHGTQQTYLFTLTVTPKAHNNQMHNNLFQRLYYVPKRVNHLSPNLHPLFTREVQCLYTTSTTTSTLPIAATKCNFIGLYRMSQTKTFANLHSNSSSCLFPFSLITDGSRL